MNRVFPVLALLSLSLVFLAGCIGGGVTVSCTLDKPSVAPGQQAVLTVEMANNAGSAVDTTAQLSAAAPQITFLPSQIAFGVVGNGETRQSSAKVFVAASALAGKYKLDAVIPYTQGGEQKSASCETDLGVA